VRACYQVCQTNYPLPRARPQDGLRLFGGICGCQEDRSPTTSVSHACVRQEWAASREVLTFRSHAWGDFVRPLRFVRVGPLQAGQSAGKSLSGTAPLIERAEDETRQGK